MFGLFNKRTERLADKALDTLQRMAEAQEAQARVFQTWLEGFRSLTPPVPSTMTDEKEVALERLETFQQALAEGVPLPADLLKAHEALLTQDDWANE